MPVSYQLAAETVHQRVARIMETYHRDLFEWELKVAILNAFPEINSEGELCRYAVTCNGYRAAAAIRFTGIKERVHGIGDAELVIDKEYFDDLNEDEKDALIDHELQHLELRIDGDGNVKTDDINRPVLKLRMHDWQMGGFNAILERHGKNALELQAFEITAKDLKNRQLLFDTILEEGANVVSGSKRLADQS
jgi:hypothetical protein